MYINTRIFPTTGYARVLLIMFIRRELGGTGTGYLFQFTYCAYGKVSKRQEIIPQTREARSQPFPGRLSQGC